MLLASIWFIREDHCQPHAALVDNCCGVCKPLISGHFALVLAKTPGTFIPHGNRIGNNFGQI
jgi:hypothetical protein